MFRPLTKKAVPGDRTPEVRSSKGNMLILSSVISLSILLPIMGFAAYSMSVFNAGSLQRSAIDAAAVAAAKDLGRIVVETPVGLVSLSDTPPNGKGTVAQDGYGAPVKSINTVLATARLNLIIADVLQDQNLHQLAEKDYWDATSARTMLQQQLEFAVSMGANAQCHDAAGNIVDPRASALKAYVANLPTQGAQKGFTLTLGMIKGGRDTTTQIPHPSQYANVSASAQSNDKYRGFVNVPYNGHDFVFAGGGQTVELVNPGNFVTHDDSLPYDIDSVVKVEAQQLVYQLGGMKWTPVAACAQSASISDPNRYPGALTVSFPNPRYEFLSGAEQGPISSFFSGLESRTRTNTAWGGDVPGSGNIGMLSPSQHLMTSKASAMWSILLHDWIKRAGPKANVQAIVDLLGHMFPYLTSAGEGCRYAFTWNPDGTIKCTVYKMNKPIKIALGDNQFHSMGALQLSEWSQSETKKGIIEVVDECWSARGKHVGQPIPDPTLAGGGVASIDIPGQPWPMMPNFDSQPVDPGLLTFPQNSGGNLLRETYLKNGLVGDITFRFMTKEEEANPEPYTPQFAF